MEPRPWRRCDQRRLRAQHNLDGAVLRAGHQVGTYNFEAYSDAVVSAYFIDPATQKPIFEVNDGDSVGVLIVAKGGNEKTHFTLLRK